MQNYSSWKGKSVSFLWILLYLFVDNQHTGLREEIVDLNSRISMQQRLIDELELSNKRANALKSLYEEKLLSLNQKIHDTEKERYKVLATLGNNR